ncbi:MAG: hypothetical protein IJE08_07550 [Clostridia bacterium]|nr:hypothetical protein [Clostridia bacterium]
MKGEDMQSKITECGIISMTAGTATQMGTRGADWWLKEFGQLPDNYITEKQAEEKGWIKDEGNLQQVAPGKLIGYKRYENYNGHLPSRPGREWYEADLDCDSNFRGRKRVVYSNDGLIFVTYDHFWTFVEIV